VRTGLEQARHLRQRAQLEGAQRPGHPGRLRVTLGVRGAARGRSTRVSPQACSGVDGALYGALPGRQARLRSVPRLRPLCRGSCKTPKASVPAPAKCRAVLPACCRRREQRSAQSPVQLWQVQSTKCRAAPLILQGAPARACAKSARHATLQWALASPSAICVKLPHQGVLLSQSGIDGRLAGPLCLLAYFPA